MANTLVSQIITDALREGNLIPVGKSPTAAEQAEALGRLNAFIKSVFGFEMGEELSDWEVPAPQRTAPVAANWPQLPYPQNTDPLLVGLPDAQDADIDVWECPPKNSRIVFGGVTSVVYFPEAPDDGSRMALVQGSGAGDGGVGGSTITLNGNGRTIGGANTQVYIDPVSPISWVYHAHTADWTAVTTLASTDTMAFPPDVDDYFTIGLSIRMFPRFGKTVSPESTAAFKQAEKRFKAKYRQAGTTVYGATQLPRGLQSFMGGQWWGF